MSYFALEIVRWSVVLEKEWEMYIYICVCVEHLVLLSTAQSFHVERIVHIQ